MQEQEKEREKRRWSNRMFVAGFAFLAFVPFLMFIEYPASAEREFGFIWAVSMSALFGLILLMVGMRLRP